MKIVTEHWLPPIPMHLARKVQWTATLDNYEPGHPVGEGETEQAAIDDLKAQLYEDQYDRDEQKADADSYTAVGHAAEVE